jgi:hypothetical protein
VDITLLDIRALRNAGLYTRQAFSDTNQRYDSIDMRPFSTDFSFTRFLIPTLTQWTGAALYTDSDVLFRKDVTPLFIKYDELPTITGPPDSYFQATKFHSKAIYCVKHDYSLPSDTTKMRGGLKQFPYPRKNWSSVMLFNCGHRANWFLTPHMVNTAYGRELQQMFWLDDSEIGSLEDKWNWLEGHGSSDIDPAIVHYTRGTPNVPGHSDTPFADEWWSYL